MAITIKVAQLGQPVAEITVADGSTVEVALAEAGVAGDRVHVNGTPAVASTPLANNDVVVATPRIRGGAQ